MQIGILDLIVIYSIPFLFVGSLMGVFLVVMYVIVKKDLRHLDVSEDIRYNIQLRKRPLTFSVFVQVLLFENGVQAAVLYRFARYFYLRGMRSIANFLHKFGKYLTNIDVSPTAKLGPGVVFLHGWIIINPYAETGRHVVFRPWGGMRGWGTVKVEDGARTGLQSMVLDCSTMGRDSESAPCAVMFKQDVPANHLAFGIPVNRVVPKPETRLEGVTLELENVLLEPTQIFDEALRSALRQVGRDLPKSRRKVKLEDLPPEKVICGQLRKEMVFREEALAEYIRSVRSGLGRGLRLRPHGKALIEKIRERGLKVSVISKQPDILAKEIAEGLDLIQSLDCIFGADDFLSEWKPQPWIVYRPMRELKIMAERVIYVAGSHLDLQTGIEAAVKVYWVAPPDVPPQPDRGIVERFPDLEAVLREFSKPQLPQTF
jgi:serine O-acetyltransferase